MPKEPAMMLKAKAFPALLATVATLAMPVVPAQAAVVRAAPIDRAPLVVPADAALGTALGIESAEHRRWRRGWRHRRGLDGGDLLAGALIIGGIAVIASAANNDRRRYRDLPPPFPADDDARFAMDRCGEAAALQAGRGARVERIDGVARDGNGWRVDGVVGSRDGFDPFICGVTNGRIDYVQFTRGNDSWGAGNDWDNRDPDFDR